ncbi:unnamed protein product [Orchesella dallaii]|uniref:Gustatory receptor n=1 Tax=Orchesella dallaii TaxID=48710 RepID=A0ABP1REX8_9HEXA
MGFSKASNQVLRHLQIFYPIPYSIQPGIIVVTNKSGKQSTLWKILWKSTKYFAAFGIILFLWRLQVLFQTWKKKKDLEQLGIIVALLSMIICGYSTIQMLETHGKFFLYVMAEYLKYMESHNQKDLNRQKTPRRHSHRWIRPSMKEILVYEMSFIVVTTYPLVVSALPLLRNYDPFVTLFSMVFGNDPNNPSLVTKMIASLIHLKVKMHTSPLFLAALLSAMVAAESTVQISHQLQLLVNKRTRSAAKIQFEELLKQYRILQLLTSFCRQFSGDLLAILVAVGVIQASGLGYISLMYYKHLPFFLYIACVFITGTVFTIIFLFVTLASIPYRNGEAFKLGCKRYLVLSRRARYELRSCSPIGFSIGCNRIVTEGVALAISDVILNCTASLVLLGDFERLK